MRVVSCAFRAGSCLQRWAASALRCSVIMLLSGCAASVWPTDADFYDICSGSAPLGRVELSPTENVSMRVGEQLQVRAQLIDTQSNPMVICAPAVSWSSSTAAVATVANGTVRAIGVGQTAITASAGDKSATLTVVVTNSALAWSTRDSSRSTPSPRLYTAPVDHSTGARSTP